MHVNPAIQQAQEKWVRYYNFVSDVSEKLEENIFRFSENVYNTFIHDTNTLAKQKKLEQLILQVSLYAEGVKEALDSNDWECAAHFAHIGLVCVQKIKAYNTMSKESQAEMEVIMWTERYEWLEDGDIEIFIDTYLYEILCVKNNTQRDTIQKQEINNRYNVSIQNYLHYIKQCVMSIEMDQIAPRIYGSDIYSREECIWDTGNKNMQEIKRLMVKRISLLETPKNMWTEELRYAFKKCEFMIRLLSYRGKDFTYDYEDATFHRMEENQNPMFYMGADRDEKDIWWMVD